MDLSLSFPQTTLNLPGRLLFIDDAKDWKSSLNILLLLLFVPSIMYCGVKIFPVTVLYFLMMNSTILTNTSCMC